MHHKVPKMVVKRLPVYLRVLDNMLRRDIEIVLSRELSDETGFTAEQIRKDLTNFGAFGTRGTGYDVAYLRQQILNIIGLNQKTPVIVVGIGHLGNALSRYNITKNPYVEIVGLFDLDPQIVGTRIMGREVLPVSELERVITERRAKVAMITVPAGSAQEIVGELVGYGINAILNFAPTKLDVPAGVHLQNVDFTIELQSLIYYVSTEEEQEDNAWKQFLKDRYAFQVNTMIFP